jgi:transposase
MPVRASTSMSLYWPIGSAPAPRCSRRWPPLIRLHVMAAERLHGHDTTVPVLARGKTITGRLRTYVRDDRPFAGPAPPAAIFFFSPDRTGQHPKRHLAEYSGIPQAAAYAGFNDLYVSGRKPGPVIEAGCWSHGRRKLFELAEVGRAPIAAEAVRRIDAIFDAERAINGLPAEQRLAVRQGHTSLRPSPISRPGCEANAANYRATPKS